MLHPDAPIAADLAARRADPELVDRLTSLVRTRSENPPGEEADAASLVADMCRALGLEVSLEEAVPGRPNVVARWRAGPGPTVAFCSHIDVVPAGDPSLWEIPPYEGRVAGERVHGRGSADAKGPVACCLEAVAMLRATGWEPPGSLELYLVADEETMGFNGAGALVERALVRPDAVIVGEPTSLRVVVAQRGACWYSLTVAGRAAHGSAPERGANAIERMAEIIRHLPATLPDITHPVVGGPSINVGTIRGGEKTNIVAASCTIEIDRRSIPGETADGVTASIEAAIERARDRFPDLEATLELAFFGKPFEVSGSSRLVEAVSGAVGEALGRPAERMGFRGASDARFFSEAGADVLVCGPGDITLAHTARESIEIAELRSGALAYALAFARAFPAT